MKKPLRTQKAVRNAYPDGIEMLEIGSGNNPEAGYVTLDIQECSNLDILANVTDMPIPDNWVRHEVRAVHILEHFCHPVYASLEMRKNIGTTLDVLQEAYRVLKPGGRFRIVTPDFEKIGRSVAAKRIPEHWAQRWSVGGHLNEYDVHHWLWTHQNAQEWFSEVGFVSLRDWNPVSSLEAKLLLNWTPPETKSNPAWHRVEWYHWLFFEGTKPE